MDAEKFAAWKRLRGMPLNMAKRRYITYMSEVNPLLIDVMPDEKPPTGFPLDRHGQPICAKCNTRVGCARPLLDQHGADLRQQLFERDELHDPAKLGPWIKNALKQQRCVWGRHMPITKAEARPFKHWFMKAENRGFLAYDSTPVMQLLRELLVYYYEVTYDMMQHRAEYSLDEYNDQADVTLRMKDLYGQLAGEDFIFEVPCTRQSKLCDDQRYRRDLYLYGSLRCFL
jgi:hypothetical protein